MRDISPPAAAIKKCPLSILLANYLRKIDELMRIMWCDISYRRSWLNSNREENQSIRTISAIFFAGIISTPGMSATSIAWLFWNYDALYHFSLQKSPLEELPVQPEPRHRAPVLRQQGFHWGELFYLAFFEQDTEAIGDQNSGQFFDISRCEINGYFVRGNGRSEFW